MTPTEAESKAYEWQSLREQALVSGELGQDFLADAEDIERELAAAGYDDPRTLLENDA